MLAFYFEELFQIKILFLSQISHLFRIKKINNNKIK